jgi:hypothetical protein
MKRAVTVARVRKLMETSPSTISPINREGCDRKWPSTYSTRPLEASRRTPDHRNRLPSSAMLAHGGPYNDRLLVLSAQNVLNAVSARRSIGFPQPSWRGIRYGCLAMELGPDTAIVRSKRWVSERFVGRSELVPFSILSCSFSWSEAASGRSLLNPARSAESPRIEQALAQHDRSRRAR